MSSVNLVSVLYMLTASVLSSVNLVSVLYMLTASVVSSVNLVSVLYRRNITWSQHLTYSRPGYLHLNITAQVGLLS